MAYVPIAIQTGAVYTLTSADGVEAVLNDPTDGNYVGMISELTGLDSAEVRESASELVEGDGGVHGDFYFGRRPVTMNVRVFGHSSIAARDIRVDRLRRASMAMRADSTLAWTPANSGAGEVFLPLRRQQPFRETGGWVKELQLAMVSEFAVIMSSTLHTSADTSSGSDVSIENKGNYVGFPIVTITGVSTNPTVSDGHGGLLKTGPSGNSLNLASGEKIQIDLLNHSAVFTAGARVGQSGNRYIDFGGTAIWPSTRGATTEKYKLSGGGKMTVTWRDTWA